MSERPQNLPPAGKKTRDLTPEERIERIRWRRRMYYQRNKHWLLEEQRQQRQATRKRRKKPKKALKPRPTPEELQQAAEARREAAEERQNARLKAKREWNELGWVVAKMNVTAGLSQEAIYTLLGGLAPKRKIAAWCQHGRKLARIRPMK